MRASKRARTVCGSDAWGFWRSLQSPRFAAAPMVWQSERCFRKLARRNGVELAYTPMINAKVFVASYGAPAKEAPTFSSAARHSGGSLAWRYDSFGNVRDDVLPLDPEDRPLVMQFCATNADEFEAAAALAAREFGSCIDMIDLNLGCPQPSARKARFGAFLMGDPGLVAEMMRRAVAAAAPLPVSAKIRVLESAEATVRFAQMLEAAGASAIAIHGRTRAQRHHEGSVHSVTIAAVVQAVGIPVIANGAVRTRADAEALLASTGAACCMAASGLLADVRLFCAPTTVAAAGAADGADAAATIDAFGRAFEYLAEARACPPPHHRFVKDHLLALLRDAYLARSDDPLYHMLVRNARVTELGQYYELTRIMARREGKVEPEPERRLLTLKEVKAWGGEARRRFS